MHIQHDSDLLNSQLHVAVYLEVINQSSWGYCIYFRSVSSCSGEVAWLEIRNSNYGNTNILVL